MKRTIIWLAVTSLLCSTQASPGVPDADAEKEIRSILERQKESWNARDIEGFMAYYWKSDEFTFQSGNNRLLGWDALLERYKTSYSGDNWGKLDFTDIEIKILAEDSAFVLGRWRLTMKDSAKEGLFTIIFRHMPEGWRIIHDHSS